MKNQGIGPLSRGKYLEPRLNWVEVEIPAEVLASAEKFMSRGGHDNYVARSIEHAYEHGFDTDVSGDDRWILHYSDHQHAEWNQPL